jgi:putative peptidoglycan lipid II flippase
MGLIALRVPLCTVLFQRGEFSDAAVLNTAQAVLGYAIGLWAIGGLRITVPAFYALKDTKTPVKIAFLAFIVNIIFGYVLGIYFSMHQLGLAIASSISATINFILLFYILNSRTKKLFTKPFIEFLIRVIPVALVMGVSTWFLAGYINWNDNESLTNIAALTGIILVSFIIYFGITKLMHVREADHLISILRRKEINT